MIKYCLVLLLLGLLCLTTSLQAQTPFINNIDKKTAYVKDTLTISGNNFGSDINDIVVSFGATQGQVVHVKESIIKVLVPAAATFGPIAVTKLSQKFTVHSASFFLPSYSGSPFNRNKLSSVYTLATEEDELYDLCTCDFDGDGDNDIATTNNSEAAKSTSISVYANQTATPDALSFTRIIGSNLNVNSAARNVTCGDLNADGKPELIVSQGGSAAENIFIFQNVSTDNPRIIKFEEVKIVNVADEGPTHGTRRIAIRDLNSDGLPEIVVSNQTMNKIFILTNESSNGDIVFNSSGILLLEVPTNTLGLALADLNQDFLPEILVVNNVGSGLYILKNNSISNQIIFDTPQNVTIPGPLINIVTGDIDGDSRIDIAITNLESNAVSIMLNQSSNGEIMLATPVEMKVANQPWGLDIGDMDGNGMPDLLIATLSSTDSITLLTNFSTSGSLDLKVQKVGSDLSVRNLKVTDLNGDAKPDLAFTKKDNTGNFTIAALRNTNCFTANITPSSPGAICESQAVTLYATNASLVTYQWKKAGVDISGADQSSLLVTSPGDYSVSMTSSHDGCSVVSPEVTVIEDSGDLPNPPTINSHLTLCEGEDAQFSASYVTGVTYHWYGPNGFSSNEQNPLIADVSTAQAGEYFLEVKLGACKSSIVSTVLEVNPIPEVKIQSGSNSLSFSKTICQGELIILSAPYPSALSYQWKKDGSNISGANTETLNVSSAGSYTIEVESDKGCTRSSMPVVISTVQIQANFHAHSKVCVGEEVIFSNQSTTDANQQATYFWNFGDGNTSSEQNPKYTFQHDGTFQVSLQIAYENNSEEPFTCISEMVKEIEVTALPEITTLPDDEVMLCTGDTIDIRMEGNFTSLAWGNGSTDSTLQITKGGTYQITAYNALGCTVMHEIVVIEQDVPVVEIAVDEDNKIAQGESVLLTATGASWYEWSPALGLDDFNSANPVASPEMTTTYTVIGYNAGNCKSTAEVTIYVSLEEINVKPRALFSPNNDGIDDHWIIENITSYPECKFIVFNLQGNLVFESQNGYNNDWDGSDNKGNSLKEGVYYYIIRCGSETNKKSGSITIVR